MILPKERRLRVICQGSFFEVPGAVVGFSVLDDSLWFPCFPFLKVRGGGTVRWKKRGDWMVHSTLRGVLFLGGVTVGCQLERRNEEGDQMIKILTSLENEEKKGKK